MRYVVLTAALILGPTGASAEVTRFEITRRGEVGASGYEKIVGTVHFAIDPSQAGNGVMADLDKAPVNPAGRVEFSADLYILLPSDPSRSNGVALVDIPNRGFKLVFQNMTGAPARNDFVAENDFGDGLLTRAGFTIVWIGWQFDVPPGPGTLSLRAPRAQGVTGTVRVSFTPNNSTPAFTVTDLAGYAPIAPDGPDTALTVRDGPFGVHETIPRSHWRLEGHVVTLSGGFEPGRTYQIAYRTANPAIAAAGFAAVRDVISWLKHDPDAPARVRQALGYGASQSGRFLRAFLYDGFNTDESGRQVFDGVMTFGAGATRLSVNERWALPNGNGFFASATFPFADRAQRQTSSGRIDGLLDNDHARLNQPKIFYVNTAAEYWGAGRSAALIHTSPDGVADVAPPENVRIYLLSSTQHLGARFPPRTTTGQQLDNTLGGGVLRGLLMALDQWVRSGTAPPASRHPLIADGSLVPVDQVRLPAIPGVAPPRGIPTGRDDGRDLPLLVPQVDEDGNDIAGLRMPGLVAPIATYTGWNFRNQAIGAPTELMPFLGSSIPLSRTKADRNAVGDPRRSIGERYRSKEHYLTLIRDSAERLVEGRYVLPDDLAVALRRAEELWNLYGPP